LPDDVRPDGHLASPVLLAVTSSFDLEKFYTLLDHVMRYDGSHTTSLCHQVDGNVSSLSDQMTAYRETRDLCGPCGLTDRSC
jgi:hypothetical protein